MISIYAPTTRARRVFIALLAFALAVALAIVASNAPAEAKDPKVYTATPHEQVAVNSSVALTFTNETETETQLAGSFSILFPAGFVDLNATVQSPAGTTWNVLSQTGDNPVIVSAASGGDRIGIGPANAVTVTVSWSDAPSGTHRLTTDGDQQAGGVFKGGNDFNPLTSEDLHPEITVCGFTLCAANFNAEISCSDECDATVGGAPVGQYEVSVEFVGKDDDFKGLIIVTLTTTDGKAPNPGKAFVQVEGVTIDQCGVSGSPPQTNCFHVNRAPPGKNLEYIVIWDLDPRFRFR